MSVRDTFSDVARVAKLALEADPDDADLLADMLEAETDLNGLLAWADEKMREELRIVNALKPEKDALSSRISRAKKREEKLRALALSLLDAAKSPKVTLDRVTFSVSTVKPKRIVVDALALPQELMKYTPDMAAIKAAETMPEGCAMDNGGKTIRISRT